MTPDAPLLPTSSVFSREERERLLGQKGAVLWFTGLSGSGKSTLAREVEARLVRAGRVAVFLDGDGVRLGLNKDAASLRSEGVPEAEARRFGLGFGPEDRSENVRRISEVARLFADHGALALTAFISPFRRERARARSLLPADRFIEIYCSAPLSVCEGRDVKGLYAKARAGDIPEFTGISSPYEPPESPEVTVDSGREPLGESVDRVLAVLRQRGIL